MKTVGNIVLSTLAPLEWNLMMSGFSIFQRKRKTTRWLLSIHTGILAVSELYCVYNGIPINEFEFRNVRDIVYYTYGLLVLYALFKGRQRLENLIKYLFKFLTNKNRKSLYRLSLGLFIFKIIEMSLTQFALTGFVLVTLKEFKPLHFFKSYTAINSWSHMSVGLYLVLIKMTHFAEKNSITTLTASVLKTERPQRQIYMDVRRFISIKKELMSALSIMPLFTFSFMFIEAIYYALKYEAVEEGTGEVFPGDHVFSKLNIVAIFMMVLQMMFVCSITTSLNAERDKLMESLEAEVMLVHDVNKSLSWVFVLEKIKEARSFEYRVSDMFPINRELLLSYGASLLTITTLFVQLLGPVVNTKPVPAPTSTPTNNTI